MTDKLKAAEARYEELGNLLSDPETLADNSRCRSLMREYKALTPIVETFRRFAAARAEAEEARALLEEGGLDRDLREMAAAQLEESRRRLQVYDQELKILLLPHDPNDEKNVIMEIRAGTGGEEAALFAAVLYRMYIQYAQRRGWKTEVMNVSETELGGFKEICFSVDGEGAYSRMKFESGAHRVQRVPATESQGRIHTSTITVAVMPEVTDDIKIDIPPEDVRMDITRASGNGGQGVNTTDSAVRLTHLPTGIVIYSQTERSQLQNKNKAWALLRSKLYDLEVQNRHDKEADLRRSQIGTGDRSEKIRTYNFPQSRVTDHRIKLTVYNLNDVMNGDLDEILDALIAADQAAKLLKMNQEESA